VSNGTSGSGEPVGGPVTCLGTIGPSEYWLGSVVPATVPLSSENGTTAEKVTLQLPLPPESEPWQAGEKVYGPTLFMTVYRRTNAVSLLAACATVQWSVSLTESIGWTLVCRTQVSWSVPAEVDEAPAVEVGCPDADDGEDPVNGAELVLLVDVTPQPAMATTRTRIPLPRYPNSRRDDGFVMDQRSLCSLVVAPDAQSR
jgi:hypothetical protein